ERRSRRPKPSLEFHSHSLVNAHKRSGCSAYEPVIPPEVADLTTAATPCPQFWPHLIPSAIVAIVSQAEGGFLPVKGPVPSRVTRRTVRPFEMHKNEMTASGRGYFPHGARRP